MVEVMDDLDSYKIPSEEIRQNREIFYGLHREHNEEIKSWLNRVQSHSDCCEFEKFTNFLTIDRFICGLEHSELKFINISWNIRSLKELITYFSNQEIYTEPMDMNEQIDSKSDQYDCEDAALTIVKYETVRSMKYFYSLIEKKYQHFIPQFQTIRMTVKLPMRRPPLLN